MVNTGTCTCKLLSFIKFCSAVAEVMPITSQQIRSERPSLGKDWPEKWGLGNALGTCFLSSFILLCSLVAKEK